VPHNFARVESWSGRTLLVHRKGAIGLEEGEIGLVPGSMGTASYLVEGRGFAGAFGSCSHGAGRVMARGEARRAVTASALRRSMRDVVYPEHLAAKLVEEAPAAYREIRGVLEAQGNLVTRRTRLEPVAVVKGG
jgi:tRNA-splicing ligase RtcB